MAGCGNPKGCGCACGHAWHLDDSRPRYDIVCPMHDLGEQCPICGPHKLYDPKERRAV